VKAGAVFFNVEQSFISKSLIVNEIPSFSRGASSSLGNQLIGELKINATGTTVGIKQTILSNAVYYENNFQALEKEGVLSHTLFSLEQNFRLRFIHLDNSGFFQVFSDPIYNLPKYFTKHNLYIQGRLFKKILQ